MTPASLNAYINIDDKWGLDILCINDIFLWNAHNLFIITRPLLAIRIFGHICQLRFVNVEQLKTKRQV